jgi:hypothetical protein
MTHKAYPTITCEVCLENKKDIQTKRMVKGFHQLCPDCIERAKWVDRCLMVGTNDIIKKFPERYAKFSKISVTCLE